jgi:hypothetical protein
MLRRFSILVLALGLLTSNLGCWSSCGERRGWFGHCHSTPAVADSTVAVLPGKSGIDCYGGEPMPGQLMSFPGSAGIPAQPIPSPVPAYPNELPMPQPSDLIPGQRVPFAPPTPAPPLDASFSGGSGYKGR